MKRLARMSTRKPHSWWWDSHISPKNSKWLSENLEVMDRSVKEMLKLIEEEGDSFAKKAEMYYHKRPELISHVEDFYRMYRALAERYDQVTGDLRRNIPSELQTQGSGSGSDFGSEPPSPSPEVTPERKPPRPKPSPRAAGFDFFLGSGGSSDNSRKGSDGISSSESNSESDSDDSKDANSDFDSSALNHRILELENELRDARANSRCEHLESGDHIDCSSRISALEKELLAADEKLQVAEAEILSLKQKLAKENVSSEAEDEPSLGKEQVPELEELVSVLEAEIPHYKQEIENLKGALAAATRQFEADLSVRDQVIEESKIEIASLSETFLQDKTCLEVEITNLGGVIEGLKIEIKEISREKSLLEVKATEQDHRLQELEANAVSSAKGFFQEKCALEARVSGLSQSHASLEAKIELLEDEIKWLEAEKMVLCADKGKHIEELNKNLDVLKLRADMLRAEKEELGAKVDTLVAEVKCRNDRINQMDDQLHQLHSDHPKLIAEVEGARRAGDELRSRVMELEEEVEGQRVVIFDSAEMKREVIRQLCFSLEHYRDGYHQLRQVLQRYKRPVR